MSDMKLSRYFDNRDRPIDYWPDRDRLFDWFEDHMRRIEDDFARNRSSLLPLDSTYRSSFFAPDRRRRLFETWLRDEFEPRVVENHSENAIEYHIPTGAGDFFKPDDLEVNVRGRDVEVRARREEKSDDGSSYALREVRRVVRVPEGVDVDRVAAEMRHNGKLIVKAPMERPPLENRNDNNQSSTVVPIKVNRVW
ncbi:hypothetical protein BIW11_00580 [Tropilaelaps mercedesae]|uniref:SHSP domain-containing protein n=1 Tax=Tropilaelaps mercedesae TaxID=418985 RepID=A0A1V9XSR7_9ACAR|nr:hypothetical protein BIW11_00580 [Tropilaelaps mercedesae]